ncbi:MAG: polysaccharide biosynthesis tyrosine autokinase [Bacteroidetes bacterium]|nr:polysaccharide biosynthesis tyrosine autokinase [Bacteroidota bacterium]
MDNSNNNTNEKINSTLDSENSEEVRRYLFILLQNKYLIISLIVVGFLTTFLYSKNLRDIYESKVTIKIEKPQGNVLDEFRMQEFGQEKTYISNQIALIKSYIVRNMAAQSLLDTLRKEKVYKSFSHLVRYKEKDTIVINELALRELLSKIVDVTNPKGVDNLEISVKGSYFKENQLIAYTMANSYIQYNLDMSRAQLTSIRKLLEEEKKKKFDELSLAEGNLEDYEKRTGIVSMEQNVTNLISNSSELQALKNSTDIEIKVAETKANQLTAEYSKIDPALNNYITAKINEPLLDKIQAELADIEIKKQIAISDVKNATVRAQIEKDADNKKAALQNEYDRQIEILRKSVDAVTPQNRADLSNDLLKSQIDLRALRTKQNAIQSIIRRYDAKFNELPSNVIEYAKLERNKTAAEKLYTTLEGKYQEALINERSRLGNASIIDPGTDNYGPIGPNRIRLILIGTSVGLALGLLFTFALDKFDKTIKTPEELENKGVSVLCWIPSIEELDISNSPHREFLMGEKSKSNISESFKALRTRLQFSKLEEKPLKSILITSSIPSEGKTTVSVNLAGSFALANKKTLILDCDLRKPRTHTIFDLERYPGLSDYLFSNCTLEEITRPLDIPNLFMITAGTIPPNPSEILGSTQMKKFMAKLEEIYDVIIVDSPPFISVTDAEILYNITDGTILVAQSNKTIKRAFYSAYQRLTSVNKHNLLGVVLNNFKYKASYGYYYEYYYYYSQSQKSVTSKKKGDKV